ncbi:MAG: PDZ domain-containing protein [Methylocystis sp.]|nr:PDZ domain-containing protein [Methylocystis sp.]
MRDYGGMITDFGVADVNQAGRAEGLLREDPKRCNAYHVTRNSKADESEMKKVLHFFIIYGFRLAFVLFACLFSTYANSENVPKIEDSEFDSEVKVIGLHLFDNPFWGGIRKEWLIRSFINKKTKTVSHQLYIDLDYTGNWHFYDSASDNSATPLHVTQIDSSVGSCSGGCSLSETIGVDMDDKVLRAHASDGYRVRLNSKSGNTIILTVSANQIIPQLDAIDSHVAAMSFRPALGVPHLGMKSIPISAHLARATGLPQGRGMIVATVEPETPAAVAGIRPMDLIISINGVATNSFEQLNKALATLKGQHTAALIVERNGETFDAKLEFQSK